MEVRDIDFVYEEFRASVLAAAPTFAKSAATMRKAANGGATAHLLEWLRSERPLRRQEREELANLIAGLWNPGRGAPQHKLSVKKAYYILVGEAWNRLQQTKDQYAKDGLAVDAAAQWAAADPRARNNSWRSIRRDIQSKWAKMAGRVADYERQHGTGT